MPLAVEGGTIGVRGMLGAARGAGDVLLALAALCALVVVRVEVSLPVVAAALTLPVLAVWRLGRDRPGVGLWGVYVAGFVVFAQLRTLADETGVPVRFDYAIALERALAAGSAPTVWLQGQVAGAVATPLLDTALTLVYLSYFLAPHVVALMLWRGSAEAFRRYVAAVLLACYTGLAISFLVPTAPPWLAASEGLLAPVTRIVPEVLGSGELYRQGGDVVGVNPVAAMPSLHTALTVVIAAAAWRRRNAVAAAGAGYAAAMGFALVYLGEHYVVDVLAGAATGVGAWFLAPAAVRLGAGAARSWRGRERAPTTPSAPEGRW